MTHSAQERQENSIPIQSELIRQWADMHGVEIINEFTDHGKSERRHKSLWTTIVSLYSLRTFRHFA